MISDHILRHAYQVEFNRKRIVAGHRKALELGASDAAVYLLDLRDRSAREIAEIALSEETIDGIIAAAKSIGAIPFVTWGMPRHLVAKEIADVFPAVANTLTSHVPLEGVWAVVVAEGSASAVMIVPQE